MLKYSHKWVIQEIALKCWQSDLEELEAWTKDRERAVGEREAAVAESEARWNVEEAKNEVRDCSM